MERLDGSFLKMVASGVSSNHGVEDIRIQMFMVKTQNIRFDAVSYECDERMTHRPRRNVLRPRIEFKKGTQGCLFSMSEE